MPLDVQLEGCMDGGRWQCVKKQVSHLATGSFALPLRVQEREEGGRIPSLPRSMWVPEPMAYWLGNQLPTVCYSAKCLASFYQFRTT